MNFSVAGLEEKQINQVRAFLRSQLGIYNNLDVAATLDYFTRWYVHPLSQRVDIQNATVVDCGSGHGWFSFAYLLAGGKQTITADISETRLASAKQIADLLGLTQKIQFIHSGIQDIPLQPNSAEIFVSIETLEHVGQEQIKRSLLHIKNVASQIVLITTPNKLFPVVPHDTRLPFVHWLPPHQRKVITRMTKRAHQDQGNQFVSPFDLKVIMDKFRPDSICLTFRSVDEFKASFPLYKPYGSNSRKRLRKTAPTLLSAYYTLVCPLFAKRTYWVTPSMACIFVRR
jgi:2-polyprenyl-3-methyl-5-hydroxy-6-metoxy-1,4-benzoquinol methylase